MRHISGLNIALVIAVIVAVYAASVEAGVFKKEKLSAGWREERSPHFIVYYNENISKKYVRRVIRDAERHYRKVADRLGFRRFSFWLWEDRTKIFIYNKIEEYQKQRHEPEWSGASVSIRKKEIYTFYLEEEFFDRFLPHEIAHIVFRELVGIDCVLPLWLDEGVACSQEDTGRIDYIASAKAFVEQGIHLTIPRLMQIEKKNMVLPTMFYAESASVVIFLQDNFNSKKFSDFCKELRDGRSLEGALEKIYYIRGFQDLNNQWEEYIKGITYLQIRGKYESTGTGG